MPNISTEFRKFAAGRPSGVIDIPVSRLQLLGTAAKVGLPTLGSRLSRSRPLMEMVWRTAIVEANLATRNSDTRWTRSGAYDRLDPTEKTSVSYFLGMVQAALTTRYGLGYSHLVHVDDLLRQQNLPLTGKRPDFVAVDPLGRAGVLYGATVEAKGRTNGFAATALATAKLQAQVIRPIRGLSAVEKIASEAYFDIDSGNWCSVLEDPDGTAPELDFGLETYLLVYYRRIVEAGRASDTWRPVRGGWQFDLPGYSIAMTLPSDLVAAYDRSAAVSDNEERDAANHLTTAYRRLAQGSAVGERDDLVGVVVTDPAGSEALVSLLPLVDDGLDLP